MSWISMQATIVLLTLCGPLWCHGGISSSLPSLSPVSGSLLPGRDRLVGRDLPQMDKLTMLSRISYSWANEFMASHISNNKSLSDTDVWRLEDSAKSMYNISKRYEIARDAVMANGEVHQQLFNRTDDYTPSATHTLADLWRLPMFRVLILMYKKELAYTGLVKMAHTVVQFIPPFLISSILRAISKNHNANEYQLKALALTTVLFMVLVLKTALDNHYSYHITSVGGGMRRAVSMAVYNKLLTLRPYNAELLNPGKLANLITMEAQRVEQLGQILHLLWDGAVQTVGYGALLMWLLGPAIFAGMAVMIGSVYLNMHVLSQLLSTRARNIIEADRRIRVTNEVLCGMRTVKSYGWEGIYREKLTRLRQAEMITLSASVWFRTIILSVMSALPSVVSVVTLGTYAYMGNELTPAKVFTAISLFGYLKHPLVTYPTLFNAISDGYKSLNSISDFLSAPELETYLTLDNNPQIAAKISNTTFSWSADKSKLYRIRNTTHTSDQLHVGELVLKTGSLTIIIGPVGSGKSMLLSALLGQLHVSNGASGFVTRHPSVSYAPQSTWLPQDSIRNTVLFGNTQAHIDWRRYRAVIRACHLVDDLDHLEYGDCTEIGEHGATLSGGQKQRISLARAVFDGTTDIYLLDDPLSALDAEVGRRVFESCILGLLGRKTRVLVTNDKELLPYADNIVVMGRGSDTGTLSILAQGKYEQLRWSLPMMDLIGVDGERPDKSSHANECHDLNVAGDFTAALPECFNVDSEALPLASTVTDGTEVPTAECHTEGGINIISDPDEEDAGLPPSTAENMLNILTAEDRLSGGIPMAVYAYYLRRSESAWLLALALASVLVSSLSSHSQQWAVARWAMDSEYKVRSLKSHLIVVMMMVLVTGLTNGLRTWLFYQSGVTASDSMHKIMLSTVLKAPLSYFESTPLGRIMIRFSRDLDLIDNQLPTIVAHLVASVVQTVASIISISAVTPPFALLMPAVLWLYYLITRNFVNLASDLKHLEAVTRVPIISHFSETLLGLSIIQSFGSQAKMIRENERRLNKNSAASFALKVANRWVSFRLEILGNALVIAAALLAIYGGSSAGASGISLNNALATTGLLNWVIRNWADTQALMHSVEKVKEFNLNTPKEQDLFLASPNWTSGYKHHDTGLTAMEQRSVDSSLSGLHADANWPWQGGIMFSNVTLRYRPHLQPSLSNISFYIKPGEAVGIVGRTGSGKSSLFRGLLRLSELEAGAIFIDGIDIATVDLSLLRNRISIIPQDPVLFAGTIRSNIDPLNVMTDGELWDVLQKAHLSSLVEQLPLGLDHRVREGGGMFSAGQRQLFCMARALVRKARVLLLDEATSSIDPHTDALIQDTVRNEFRTGACTVLTVAHRLKTVLDLDKILVMQDGCIAEHASPKYLTNNKDSLFAQFLQHQQCTIPSINL